MKAYSAVLTQFVKPGTAHSLLKGEGMLSAAAATTLVILAVGFLPFILQGGFMPGQVEIPFIILLERVILSGAAGLSAWALSHALYRRKTLFHAVLSAFLSMGAFMILIALLTMISYILGLPGTFTWSPAELMTGLPENRMTVFLILFAARLDLASLVTVHIWGRGLSAVWDEPPDRGSGIAWTVYLFGILLITMPVFLAP